MLEDLSDGASGSIITVAYIYNVKKLIVSRAICADLSFYNVGSVNFLSNSACQKKPINLRLVDSSANQVPRQLSRLEVTRSKVEKVECDMGLQKVLFSNAQIGVFNAPWPIAGSYQIKIEDSSIDTFIALNIESQVFLLILNSTFKKVSRQALVLGRGASAAIYTSDIMCEDDAIIVKGGAKLTVKDTTGKISLMGTPPGRDAEMNKRPPGVPQVVPLPSPMDNFDSIKASEDNRGCTTGFTWLWFVPTVVATLECIVIIVLCGKQIPEPVPSGPDFENPDQIKDNFQGPTCKDSSFYYYDENIRNYPTAFKRK